MSIIIPAYKAEKFVKNNLEKFQRIFIKVLRDFDYSFEIICVVDGTSLDNTFTEAKKVKGVNVVGYKNNRGKGYALRYGFTHSIGELIIFFDVDGDFNPTQIKTLLPYLNTADIVIGSKRHPFSKLHYPLFRRFLSKGFQLLSKMLLGISLKDTQSGIKCFHRLPLSLLLPLCSIDRFAFDLELCFLAQKHGFRTIEAPIWIDFKGRSTIEVNSIYSMFKDMLKIRYLYSFKKQYQKTFYSNNFK